MKYNRFDRDYCRHLLHCDSISYVLLHFCLFLFFFFFFQAEDGIRDTSVTGVQTCALPISPEGAGTQMNSDVYIEGAGAVSLPPPPPGFPVMADRKSVV